MQLLTTRVPGDFSDITDLQARAYNGQGYTYKGVDVSGNYLLEIGEANSLNFRLLATHMIDQKFQTLPTLPDLQRGRPDRYRELVPDGQPAGAQVAHEPGRHVQSRPDQPHRAGSLRE